MPSTLLDASFAKFIYAVGNIKHQIRSIPAKSDLQSPTGSPTWCELSVNFYFLSSGDEFKQVVPKLPLVIRDLVAFKVTPIP